MARNYEFIAGLIDHAILHPTVTDAQILAELRELRSEPLASICIKPSSVPVAAEELAGTSVKVCTVIGFPHGTSMPETKAFEAELALKQGAAELDMVINTGKVLSADWSWVRRDIESVLLVAREYGGLLKVIFETDFLTDHKSKLKLCEICGELAVDFVKTSTGFGYVQGGGGYDSAGATDEDLKLMRKYSPPSVGVKASGGVRHLDRVLEVVELGAARIGTSSTRVILKEARERFGGQV